jgi:hypothetical protein
MRLADVVLRRGHLSESALVEVWSSGLRPGHLERCDQCATRALEMSRWLEDVQALGRADADAVFSDDRLTAQRGQVLDRLAQLDRPSKVISFPAASAAARQPFNDRRVNPGWLAAAAAAGLMIGVVTMELSYMVPGVGAPPVTSPSMVAAPAQPAIFDGAGFLDGAYDRPSLGALQALEDMTPRAVDFVLTSNSNR